MRGLVASLAPLALCGALGACSIPETAYQPSPDAAIDAGGGVGFVVDDFPATVDELGSQTFTVKLSQAPTAPVQVVLDVTGPITASPDRFELSDASWQAGQQVTLAGLDDVDVADADATVDVTATDLEHRLLATVVHDTDHLEVRTSAVGTLSVDELGTAATFTVVLSAQPTQPVALALSAGPGVQLDPATSLTFQVDQWSQPLPVRVIAPDDANVVNEAGNITLHETTGNGLTDVLVPYQVLDNDVLQIVAVPTPAPLNLIEQGAPGSLAISLSQQPPTGVTVTLTTTAGVTVDSGSVAFTTSDWGTPQHVPVRVPMDDDTVGGTATITLATTILGAPVTRTVPVNFTDDDHQTIQENAPSSIGVTEGQSQTFDVWLAFRPQGTVQIDLGVVDGALATVSPSTLFFTDTDFSVHQPVRVDGVSDANLVGGSTSLSITGGGATPLTIPVVVTDDDVQQIVVSPSPLAITEGGQGTLLVHLAYQPTGPVMVTATSSNPDVTLTGVPLSFGPTDYADKMVTVAAAVDSDTTPDTATVTFSGAAAPSNAVASVDVADTTVITTSGWPTMFASTLAIANASVIAYQVPGTVAAATLDRFGLIAAAAGGDVKLALYADAGNVPGALVRALDTRTTITAAGPLALDAVDTPLVSGSYWIAVRASPSVSLTASGASPTALRCSRNITIASLDTAWPTSFGAATCGMASIPNLSFVTYR